MYQWLGSKAYYGARDLRGRGAWQAPPLRPCLNPAVNGTDWQLLHSWFKLGCDACNIQRCAQRYACSVDYLLFRGPVRNVVASCVRKSFTDDAVSRCLFVERVSEMDWLNCLTVLLWVICLILLVICLCADCFSLSLSFCLPISLYLYFVCDFYNK